MKSVEKVIDMVRGRRAPAPAPTDSQKQAEAPDAAPSSSPPPEIHEDVAQLHLAATVAANDADDA
jgi:hypothetical protein